MPEVSSSPSLTLIFLTSMLQGLKTSLKCLRTLQLRQLYKCNRSPFVGAVHHWFRPLLSFLSAVGISKLPFQSHWRRNGWEAVDRTGGATLEAGRGEWNYRGPIRASNSTLDG